MENRRCFIMGNGPSLNKIDMTLLKDEITFGANRVYLGFEEWGFNTTYWSIIDTLQIEQCFDDYNKYLSDSITKYVPMQYRNLFTGKNIIPVNVVYSPNPFPQFANDFNAIYDGWNVVYMMLQIAYLKGFKEIYLVGVDYNYTIGEEQKRGSKWSDKNSINHFTKDYNADDKGVIWNMPNFEKTDESFAFAANFLKEQGVKVYNATPDSKLEVFEKVDYHKLFNDRRK